MRAPIQDEPRDPKVKIKKGSGSQNCKPTCVTCGMKHYDKCLVGTGNFFGFGNNIHKVGDCPNILGDNISRKNHFYALRTRGSKSDDEDDVCKL